MDNLNNDNMLISFSNLNDWISEGPTRSVKVQLRETHACENITPYAFIIADGTYHGITIEPHFQLQPEEVSEGFVVRFTNLFGHAPIAVPVDTLTNSTVETNSTGTVIEFSKHSPKECTTTSMVIELKDKEEIKEVPKFFEV